MIVKTARRYTPGQAYTVVREMLRMVRHVPRGKEKSPLGFAFFERLMLAVTQVNGCAICGYHHAAEALKAGLAEAEIREILSGSFENIPPHEGKAVLFAQHYADTRGRPQRKAWLELVQTYGEEKALSILAVIRTIMFGNVFGIPLSSLHNRIRGKKEPGSSLVYDLGMILLVVPLLLIGSLHGLLGVFSKPDLIRFAP